MVVLHWCGLVLLLSHRETTTTRKELDMSNFKSTFTVQITYKSGKIEKAEIEISKYADALGQLISEGRLVSMEIIG